MVLYSWYMRFSFKNKLNFTEDNSLKLMTDSLIENYFQGLGNMDIHKTS